MKRKKCNTGGDISTLGNIASAALSFIPGMGPVAGGAVELLTQLIGSAEDKARAAKTVVSATPGNYNYGGDIKLSNDAFQVKGNPDKTDGNKYNYGGTPIALDHNEVVKNSFVFSDDLLNPFTNKSFAAQAKPIAKAVGELEKRRLDTISKNSLKWNNKNLEDLKDKQETIATILGLRENKSTDSYQNGGPVNYDPFNPYAASTNNTYSPNWQTLDNIKFDSNKATIGKYGELIVHDVNSGRDFGVKRKSDGTYDYFRGGTSPLKRDSRLQNYDNISDRFIQVPAGQYRITKGADDPAGNNIYFDPVSGELLSRSQNFPTTGQYQTITGSNATRVMLRPPGRVEGKLLYDMNKQYGSRYLSENELNNRLKRIEQDYGFTYSDTKNYAEGGPLPWEGFDTLAFQQWYNTQPGVTKLAEDSIYGPKTTQAFNTLGNTWATSLNMVKTPEGYKRTPIVNNEFASLTSSMPDSKQYSDPLSMLPIRGLQLQDTLPYADSVPLTERVYQGVDSRKTGAPQLPSLATPPIAGQSTDNLSAPTEQSKYKVPTTFGDILQMIEVGSKFGNAFKRAEVEPNYQVNAPITQEVYDPRNALTLNQRNYQNALNSVQGSINTRRAVAASLLSNKLTSDNSVLADYNRMNQGARSNYENRLAQRQAVNNQLRQYTNDVNSRNRAARHNLIDNAFTSLGNLGEAFNAKRQSGDAMELLRLSFPEVSDRVLQSLTREDLLRIFRNGRG